MSYREITTPISLSNINAQVETFMRTVGFIKNSESVAELSIDFNKIQKDAVTGELVAPVRVKSYKEGEVRLIKHG